MTTNAYDAIVVGARCAGSPAARLLARKGYKVLLADRDRFPSDTLSTHMIHAPGVALLRQWGLLDRLIATGCPAITRYSYDFGPFRISGTPRPIDGVDEGYGPRRTILDKLLIDAASDAGAEVREGFTVEEVVFDGDRVAGVRGHARNGTSVTERARVVIGGDGRHSVVARAVRPEQYKEKPPLQCGYYAYWSNLPTDGFEIYVRPGRGWATIPTHDNLTLVVVGWPHAEFEANRKDVEGAYLRSFDLVPEFAERVRRARRESPFRGGTVPNFLRKPFGPGWALIGDAGYIKDPVTAWGMSDAFRDAELCTAALDESLAGKRSFDEAMAGYQRARDDQSLPMFDLTCELATLEPPPPEMQRLLGAAATSRDAQDQFVSMMAGTLPVPAFFAPENVGRIMAAAGRPEPQ
jgi:flavin-dependent dehydrogenase